MTASELTWLWHGPYTPPGLRLGERASCLFRDCEVAVVGISAGRLSWPLCRRVGYPSARPSLLVTEELARAIRCESAEALKHWWSVSHRLVTSWRKCFGVGRMDSEASTSCPWRTSSREVRRVTEKTS